MKRPAENSCFRVAVDLSLKLIRRPGFHSLRFDRELEDRFEADSRVERAHRLWFEGLIALLAFNLCLVLDFILIEDRAWLSVVKSTLYVTPVALGVNLLMRLNPPRRLREGSVAASTVYICAMNLNAEGRATPTNVLFGTLCVLITALFVGVVMRLRFGYSFSSIVAMVAAGAAFLWGTASLGPAEKLVGSSLLLIGAAIIVTAAYSLEREERAGYLHCLQGKLKSDELARINLELKNISSLDKLTGLPNRRALEERLSEVWCDCMQRGTTLAAIVVDIDHFKVINDVYGHLYGDEALRRIAALLPQALRGKQDMAARFGGEEFVLLLPDADQTVTLDVAERIRRLVETAGTPLVAHANREKMMWATVSCGVSLCVPTEALVASDLIDSSDKALYDAKHNGRNRVEFQTCMSAAELAKLKPEASAMPQRRRSDRHPERRDSESSAVHEVAQTSALRLVPAA